MKKSESQSTPTKLSEAPVRGLTPSEDQANKRAEADKRAQDRQTEVQSQKVPPPQGQYVIAYRDGKKRYMPLEIWLKMTPSERMKFSFQRTADPRNHYQLKDKVRGARGVRVFRTLG